MGMALVVAEGQCQLVQEPNQEIIFHSTLASDVPSHFPNLDTYNDAISSLEASANSHLRRLPLSGRVVKAAEMLITEHV